MQLYTSTHLIDLDSMFNLLNDDLIDCLNNEKMSSMNENK